ncbi:MAG: hypothetical protein GF401_05535 [Chitinivibrionales bacterium]|nr:hypothetical protein [Chitinivibrionales bacterium]
MLELVAKDPQGNNIFISGLFENQCYKVEIEGPDKKHFSPCELCFTTRLAAELAAREASRHEIESSEFCKTLVDLAEAQNS